MMRQDDIKAELLSLWSESLPSTELTGDTDFIEAGGTSLKLMSLFIKCVKVFNVKMHVKDFPRLNTMDRQCDYIAAQLLSHRRSGET